MATIQQHHIKALTPTWFLVKVTPAPAPREGGSSKKPAVSCSPLLLSPAAWQRAQEQDEKNKSKDGAERGGGLPASPRISCMGQVKGRTRRACSSARGPAPTTRGSGSRGGGGGKVAALVLGLLSGRRNARTSRACAKVSDVPASSRGGGGGRRGAGAAAATMALVLDPPLPVLRRLATDENAPSLWERRRGGKALEGLQLT
ncbi:unnamed protein product [Urochloa decumbens]|uniref:Uncharacterized protein n=1 Tax=Urochloa decumbens TaxID=240449 RepID=A0ABC8X043_9POAL